MTESCCDDTQCEADGSCPSSGSTGKPVAWQTVAALTVGRVPPNQTYWLCEDSDCPIVYFGADGKTIALGDVAPEPGFKAASDGLVCYCYLYRHSDLERDASGDGPFPTVVAVPGCSGVSLDGPATDAGRPGDEADRLFRRHYARMAERLCEGGFGVVLIDYLTAEGVANTCSGEIAHERVGEYVEASLAFAANLPRVDTSRIYIAGWSHGGSGTIAWLQRLERKAAPGAAGAVAVYLRCGSRGPWVSSILVFVVLAQADDIAPLEECDQLLTRLPDGTRVEVRRYADARHGFDFTEGPEVLPIGGNRTVGRNPRAGEEAWKEVFAFLDENR